MNSEERLVFDNYQAGRSLQIMCIRVPVGDKGAERNEIILWPEAIMTWPEHRGLDYMNHAYVRLFMVALESERSGVFERIRTAHTRSSSSGSGVSMSLLDPVEYAEMFENGEIDGENEL